VPPGTGRALPAHYGEPHQRAAPAFQSGSFAAALQKKSPPDRADQEGNLQAIVDQWAQGQGSAGESGWRRNLPFGV